MRRRVLITHLAVWLVPLACFGVWQWWLTVPKAAVELTLVSLTVVALMIWWLTVRSVGIERVRQQLHRREYWRFAISPFLLTLGVIGALLVTESWWWREGAMILGAIGMGAIFQNLFNRFFRPTHYVSRSFETLSLNVNVVALFLLVTTAYSFVAFLNTPVWEAALTVVIFGTLLTYQTFWISGITLVQSWRWLIVLQLLFVEFFWVLVLLPHTYYVKGALVLVAAYIGITIARNQLLGILTNQLIRRYLAVGGIAAALILLSAQWL